MEQLRAQAQELDKGLMEQRMLKEQALRDIAMQQEHQKGL